MEKRFIGIDLHRNRFTCCIRLENDRTYGHQSIPRDQSVREKTDPHDARLLSLYLSKNLLPEVRLKNRDLAQLASLTQTRDTLVKQRSALKNKVNNILSARGLNLAKEALSSEKKLAEVLECHRR